MIREYYVSVIFFAVVNVKNSRRYYVFYYYNNVTQQQQLLVSIAMLFINGPLPIIIVDRLAIGHHKTNLNWELQLLEAGSPAIVAA